MANSKPIQNLVELTQQKRKAYETKGFAKKMTFHQATLKSGWVGQADNERLQKQFQGQSDGQKLVPCSENGLEGRK